MREHDDLPDGADAPEPVGGARRRPRWRRTAVVGVLLPLAAASVLVWSASGRQAHVDKIPVAIVNNDKILTEPQPMAAGRSLTAALTHPKSPKNNLKWTLTDSKDATAGLADGTFYAVLTIPENFSSAILSSGTDKPVRGRLTLVNNGAASTTVPYISHQVAAAAAGSLGTQTTQGYLTNVYSGFNQLAKSNSSAASSAGDLAGGTKQVSQGATKLDQGADSLAGSLQQVASGAGALTGAAGSVSAGAAKVHTGASGVANGAHQLHEGTVALAGGARTLAGRSQSLARGSRALAAGAKGVSGGVHRVTRGSRGLAVEYALLSRACTGQGGSVVFCDALARGADHARLLAGASGQVDGAAATLSRSAAGLASGAGALAAGNARLAGQAQKLAGASGRLAGSASQVASGAGSVAQGAAGVDSAAGQLAAGTSSTAEAGSSLASGSRTLASSAGQTDSGAQSLSSGLAKGAKDSPTYSTAQQNALLPVVSQPTELSNQVQYTKHGNGWLIAVIVAVTLWLAALVTALTRDLTGIRRHALAPVASRRLAVGMTVPVLGLAVLQTASIVVAVVLFHGSTAALVPLTVLTLLAAVTFSVLALAFRLAGGRVGITLFVLLLIVQLAASNNVIPLETAPTVLQRLNGLLPLTAYVNGASQLVSGGHVASYVGVAVLLLLWTAVGFAVLLLAVKRRRAVQPTPRRATLVPAG